MIPAARLCAKDLYQQLDWLAQGWDDDEMFVTRRLCRLRDELKTFFRHNPALLDQALNLYAELWDTRNRQTPDAVWRGLLVRLRTLIAVSSDT